MHGLTAELGRLGRLGPLGHIGGLVVFLSVLLQQLGVPIPAEPTLMIAGSAGARNPMSLPRAVGAALLALTLADSMWFALGRRYGRRALALIHRWSRAPNHWVQRAEAIYRRRGLKSVALIKFVPGLPMLAPLFAGTMQARYGSFLLYDLTAGLIWASVAVGCGVFFHRRIDALLAAFARMGPPAVAALAVGIAGAIGWNWWKRRPRRVVG